MVVISVLLFLCAAILLSVGTLSALKKLPGNPVFGLRVQEARKSEEAWNTAHAVAGPIWIVAGVSFVFGGLVALQATGWMWLIPAFTTLLGVVGVSYGANLGARTAVIYDRNVAATSNSENAAEGCCSSSASTDEQQDSDQPAAEVNLQAVRDAARHADGTSS